MATEPDDAIWLNAHHQVTIIELAQCSGLPEGVLRELVEFGALEPRDPHAVEWVFSGESVASVRAAARVCHDFEFEMSAVTLSLVLSFFERINQLEAEVRYLKASR
jgi:MerR-like DNA binding protein